jgi:hypothetical protein
VTDKCHQECHQCKHQILERSRRGPLEGRLQEPPVPAARPGARRQGGHRTSAHRSTRYTSSYLRQAALWQDGCQHDAESGAIWPVAPSGSRPWQTGSSDPKRRSLARRMRPAQVLQNAAEPRRNSPSPQTFESTDNPPPSEPERLPCAFSQTTAVPERHCGVKHCGSA